MKTLAIANQKGGVGKSTLAVHIAYAAAEKGQRVLLVDLDRQGSLSFTFEQPAGSKYTPGMTASSLFAESDGDGRPEVGGVLGENLAIIRADETLARLTSAAQGVEKRPARALRRFADDFDLCVIDTPGAIGSNPPMTIAALCAADAVICPCAVGLYELKGLADLVSFVATARKPGLNPKLRFLGLLPSKVNTKSPVEREQLAGLRASPGFGRHVLGLMLAERAAVKQSIIYRRPVWRGTKGAGHLAAGKEWRAVCDEILTSLEGAQR